MNKDRQKRILARVVGHAVTDAQLEEEIASLKRQHTEGALDDTWGHLYYAMRLEEEDNHGHMQAYPYTRPTTGFNAALRPKNNRSGGGQGPRRV